MDELFKPDFLLHVLRNPYGHSEGLVRRVRRQAADQLEQQQAILANIRALCAQENHDGYPWDEIYKLTNGEE